MPQLVVTSKATLLVSWASVSVKSSHVEVEQVLLTLLWLNPGQDITARLAQEREYTKLIDTANAPIFGVDNHGAVNVWNKNAHKLVGYAPEEVMGKKLVTEFITDDFKTAVQTVLDQALHGEETANFEFPLMTKGGVRLDVLLNATTRRDEQGNIIGVVGIGKDEDSFV